MKISEIILESIIILDKVKQEISEHYIKTGDEVGPYLEYEIIDNNSLSITYGWNSYEEGEDSVFNIIFTDDEILIDKNTAGSNVYSNGSYDESETFILTTQESYIEWLNQEIQ